jgi:hypothetical protein
VLSTGLKPLRMRLICIQVYSMGPRCNLSSHPHEWNGLLRKDTRLGVTVATWVCLRHLFSITWMVQMWSSMESIWTRIQFLWQILPAVFASSCTKDGLDTSMVSASFICLVERDVWILGCHVTEFVNGADERIMDYRPMFTFSLGSLTNLLDVLGF